MANDSNTDPSLNSSQDNNPPDSKRRAVIAGWLAACAGGALCLVGGFLAIKRGRNAQSSGSGGRINLGNAQQYAATKNPVKVTINSNEAFVDSSSGILTIVSGICTHQGCSVDWDSATSTFVCPCHDSIFNRSGAVVQGPAKKPLPEIAHAVEDGILYANG